MAAIMSFVDMKLGISFVPALVAHRESSGNRCSIAVSDAPVAMDYHCITRSDDSVPQSVQVFSKLLSEAAAQAEGRD